LLGVSPMIHRRFPRPQTAGSYCLRRNGEALPNELWPTCPALGKTGKPCGGVVVHGSAYCSFHTGGALKNLELCKKCRPLLRAALGGPSRGVQ
jgi:hypothetical protein